MSKISELQATIGRKRFVGLLVLLVLNVLLAAAWQQYLLPQSDELTNEKNATESDRSRLQQEIIDLPAKYDALKKNEARYDALMAHGFTQPQDRIVARQKLDNLRAESGLRGISYNIQPLEVVKGDQDYALTDQMVRSQIDVTFESLTDVEIRDFIDKMRDQFNGLIVLKEIALERKDPLNEENLLKLSKKTPVDFITGKATFSWYDLVPKPGDGSTAATQAFGGVSQ